SRSEATGPTRAITTRAVPTSWQSPHRPSSSRLSVQTADPVAVERAKARRKRNVLVALSAAVLIPLGAMVAANHVDTPVPTPVWTEEALPVPDEDENGWSLIGHYHSTTISGIKLDALDKLLAVSKDG